MYLDPNSEFTDGKEWIGCDRCSKWNHSHCQVEARPELAELLKDENFPYFCLTCTAKNSASKKTPTSGLPARRPAKEADSEESEEESHSEGGVGCAHAGDSNLPNLLQANNSSANQALLLREEEAVA